MRNKVYCLVGPSGVGKDTIKNEIMLPHIVSYRTRAPRSGEVDGRDGHFISKQDFSKMDKENLWIAKTEYAGNFYGITQGEILPLEDTPLLYVVDWNGVETLRNAFEGMVGYSEEDVVSIFIRGDKNDIEKRMRRQGRADAEIAQRMLQYEFDKEVEVKCDYVVMNQHGALDAALKSVYEIIMYEQGLSKAIIKGD